MTKTVKIVLAVVLAVVLIVFAALLGVGWMAYSWVSEPMENVTAQAETIRKEADAFAATLPDESREKFQACMQQASTPGFRERMSAGIYSRAEKECSPADAENMSDVQESMNCSREVSAQFAIEFLRGHLEYCKRQL